MFYIEVELINNVVLVSGVQPSDLVVRIHISIILNIFSLKIIFPKNLNFFLGYYTTLNRAPCAIAGSCWLSVLFFFLTLQYCIGFAIYQNESPTGIHMFPILNPPPSPYHPSGSSQCTSPKHPVSCIKPGLATRFIYDIIHVSMPFSQIIPPSPSPTEFNKLFYTSVSLLLSWIEGYFYHLSKFHYLF